jgi:hypothetical protein
MINNQKEFLQNDPIEIIEIIFQHESLTMLQNNCIEIICQEPNILFGTDKILKLSAELLELFLKRDDLALKEIEIWNNLIKWTHARHSTIDTDTSKWDREDSKLMEEAVSRFIPLIRFQDITSKEFSYKILPYEDLLPKKLKHEILNSYLDPSTKQIEFLPSRMALNSCKIDSVIINEKYMALFASWIDRKSEAYDLKRVPYNFNLILRASEDGFSASSFHEKCDEKGATIVIAKIKGTNKIVGGYNPYSWSRIIDGKTKDSFIFLFDDYRSIDTGNLYRVINESCAVMWNHSLGANFGYDGDCVDLVTFSDGRWSSKCTSYPEIDVPLSFDVDDYEVFSVIKK